MKKVIPIFLLILFFLAACGGQDVKETKDSTPKEVKKDTSSYISLNHGTIGVFPSYKYLGMEEASTEKGNRKYYLWEHPRLNKYILILQIVPKEGTFPENIKWVSPDDALYIKGMRAAYSSISLRTYEIIKKLGARLPDCFILAEEVHVIPEEALFRILIVPDAGCSEDYAPVMEELDRVTILNPLALVKKES